MKKFMIIDGSSLLYRAFFAIPGLKNALGVPTNAVYGFLTMFLKAYEELQPDYVAVSFDKGRDTFRKEIYPEYKANRDSAPDDLAPQFSLIKEVLAVLGIDAIELDNYEGDDIIGSLSKKWGSEEVAIKIVTGDKDILQLIDAHTDVYLTKKGISETLQVTLENMKELYGYGPDKVADMKGLMGDSSDNIPGIKGVGQKTALKFITAYGNIEGLYKSIDEIKGKMKEKLVAGEDIAYLSRKLATIKTDIPTSYKLEDFKINVHVAEMKTLFNSLGLHRLIDRCVALEPNYFEEVSLFEEIETNEGLFPEKFIKDQDVAIMFTVENEVPNIRLKKAYFYNGKETYVLDQHEMKKSEFIDLMKKAKHIITIDAKNLINSNFNELNNIWPVDKESNIVDLTLIAYLLDPTRTNYGLTYLCERFGIEPIFPEDIEAELLQGSFVLHDAYKIAYKALVENGLEELYKNIELPLIRTLCIMENNGIFIDIDELESLKKRFDSQIEELTNKIYELAGEEFNINSPKQLGVVLFENLGLPVIKKTKTGYSTNAEVLEQLKNQHPIIELILEYRTVAKLLSTYVEGLFPLINKETNRIYTTFNQMVTATGRLSSSNPNLQNIPVRTKQGRQIRSLFKPGKEFDYLMSADYSQIELRVLAHLSQDPSLIKAFNDGMDIHRHTAAEVLGKSLNEVTDQERSHAKAVNFGIIYGISSYGLAKDLGISRKAAQDYIDTYFHRYPTIKSFMDGIIEEARKTGEVKTMFNRVRALPDINNRNFNRRAFAERTAMNTPIQGSAADIIKLAMNSVQKRLEKENLKSRLLLQVHDELVLEVVEEEKEYIEKIVREEMEQIVKLNVPLIVDVHSAKDWALAK